MADMALTITEVERRTVFGDRRYHIFDVTFDSSYPTGGEPLPPADLGMNRLDQVLTSAAIDTVGAEAVVVAYDFANELLMAFETGATVDTPLDEVDAAVDLSAFTARVVAIGV